jgi:protein involved in polysaccharide export with SLBB domain
MNAFFSPCFRIFILAATICFLLSCSSTSKPGSIAPATLDQNSFADISTSSASNSTANVYNPAARLDNEIAPGYLIEMHSNQDQSLNGEYRISEQGFLDLPYEVKVTSSDTSIAELRSKIRDSYRTFFRGTPDIEITVKERKVWVRAQGLVNKPGTYLLESTGGLDEIIALADGLKPGTDGISAPRFAKINDNGQVAVIRLSDFYAGNSNLVSHWRGGENVFFQNDLPQSPGQSVFDTKYVHVLGQVRAPGEYAFKESAGFLYYLVQAGGPTDRADTDKILLVSSKSPGTAPTTSNLALSDLENSPAVQGGDVLFILADNPSDLERDTGILGNLGGFIGAIATTVLVGKD